MFCKELVQAQLDEWEKSGGGSRTRGGGALDPCAPPHVLKVQAGEACRLGWGATTLVSVVGTVRVGASGRCFALEDGTGFVEVSVATKQPPRFTGTTVRCLGHIVDGPDGRRLHATSVTVVRRI